jgi:two-component system response regulator QseB
MPRRILIVEDESLIGWSMANALGRAGYDPKVVECGEEAVEAVRGGGIDLLISDYHLPRMGGLDLATRVKEIAPFLPVVMLCADEELCGAGIASAGEIDYFIDKPFQLNDIVTLVRGIFESSILIKSPGLEN